MAISGATRHRCQISTANARLFRYNLAEVSHPTDINILIRVTIYSNNLTILTHAEQMDWGRSLVRELVGGEGALAETGWPAGRSRGEDKELLASSCQQIGSWNDPRFPLPGQPTYTLMSQTAGDVREILNGRRPFIYSFISLENLLSAYYGPGTVPDAVLCAYMYVCVHTHVCTCMYVCACECVWSQIHY